MMVDAFGKVHTKTDLSDDIIGPLFSEIVGRTIVGVGIKEQL
jgi:hypothetical protein